MNNNQESGMPHQTPSSPLGSSEKLHVPVTGGEDVLLKASTELKVFLSQLRKMHPLLPELTVNEYIHRASLGLGRHDHPTQVNLLTLFDNTQGQCHLHWTKSPMEEAEFLDYNRITEDSAEAIALGLVHVLRGWVVRRRLQRGEFADWLLRDKQGKLVALEISGLDDGDGKGRLVEKVKQVASSTSADSRVACVVELTPPRALLETA